MDLKKILSVFLAFFIMAGTLTLKTNADSIFDNAIEVGNETVEPRINYESEFVSYKMNVTEDGVLSVQFKFEADAKIYFLNSDGVYIICDDAEMKSGNVYFEDDYISISCERSSGMCAGTATYKVTEGTYYIAIENGGKFELTFDFPNKAKAEIDYFEITMEKGTTIKLGPLVNIRSDEKVMYKSSKPSVASISSNGKVTAKKSGSTMITITVGDSVAKIKINGNYSPPLRN